MAHTRSRFPIRAGRDGQVTVGANPVIPVQRLLICQQRIRTWGKVPCQQAKVMVPFENRRTDVLRLEGTYPLMTQSGYKLALDYPQKNRLMPRVKWSYGFLPQPTITSISASKPLSPSNCPRQSRTSDHAFFCSSSPSSAATAR